MTIHRINETLYAVESESTDRSYTVNLAGNGSCSCPHHTYRAVVCKHILACRNLPQPTGLERAATKAAGLTDEELLHWAKAKGAGPEAAACWLELAKRRNLVKAENEPTVDLVAGTCTCREFCERRDGKRIGVIWITCRHLDKARREASQPKPIPAGVLVLLEGASEAERARALEIYR
jgi:hypothetical protein